MRADPATMLDAVCDEETFVAFVACLAADRAEAVSLEKAAPSPTYGSGMRGWETNTIEAFLANAVAWAGASEDGLKFHEKPDNPWKRCADIIYMGKVYE